MAMSKLSGENLHQREVFSYATGWWEHISASHLEIGTVFESLTRKTLQSRSMVLIQLTVFSIIVYVAESLVIIAQSSFTVTILCREWLHFKRLSPVEMILISLGISHFCLQWASIVYNFCAYSRPDHVFWNLSLIWEFMNILTFWLTSLLAAFYCIKITSFTHFIFRWLRWRLLRLIPWSLLGALMISCVTIIPSIIRNYFQKEFLVPDHSPRNSTLFMRLKLFEQYFSSPQRTISLSVPFLLFLVCIVLLVVSLVQHWGQMQRYNTSNSSMKAQSTALRSLAIFFIFFTSYFLTVIISFIGNSFDKRSWFWVWEAVIYGMVCIHSTSLMLSSPTLKRVLKTQC